MARNIFQRVANVVRSIPAQVSALPQYAAQVYKAVPSGVGIFGIQPSTGARLLQSAAQRFTGGGFGGGGGGAFGPPGTQPRGQILSTAASAENIPPPAGGGGGGGYEGGGGQAPLIPEPTGPQDEALAAIEADYQATLGQIAGEEERLRGELPQAVSEVETAQQRAKSALEQEKGQRLSQIGTREQEQQRATQSSLEELRNLFRETERRNIAQLSAGGLTRSSTAEALTSLLGREMAQRISGQLGTRDEVLRNLSEERKRTENYFGQQVSSLEQETANKVREANLQFRSALNQLGAVRGQAAVAKQEARAGLFQQFQAQLYQIQQANQQAKMALQNWRGQMQQRLSAAQQSAFNLSETATNAAALSKQLNIPLAGVQYQPTTRIPVTYYFGRRQIPEEETIPNPFEQNNPIAQPTPYLGP